MKRICALCTLIALAGLPAFAQTSGLSVSEDSGPLREISRNVRAGSGPVYDPGRSISAGNAGSLSGNPVSGSTTGTLKSGPVSDVSMGAVTSGVPVSGGGNPSDASVGAVTRNADVPLRTTRVAPTAQHVADFTDLQEQVRAIEPLPQQDDTFAEDVEAEPADSLAQNGAPHQPNVEPPDAAEDTEIDEPQEPGVDQHEIPEQPPPPEVRAPAESVEIPIPGQPAAGDGE